MTVGDIRYATGRVIRRRRMMADITLAETSRLTGISISHLSEVERGKKNISSEALEKIAHMLGMTTATMLREIADEITKTSRRGTR